MTDWQPIATVPSDWQNPLPEKTTIRVRDKVGREYDAQRTVWFDSKWMEAGTRREIWPVEWHRQEGQG